MWDLNKPDEKRREVRFTQEFKYHTKCVGDIASHFYHGDVFITGDDDGELVIWDTRDHEAGGRIFNKKIYNGEIYSVAFSPKNEYVLAAAGSEKDITVWDIRNMTNKLFSLEGHTADVTKLQWSPTEQSLLWSGGADKRIITWDLS